jgi:predicted  nucleic acid-binding Zn-ribbon protein
MRNTITNLIRIQDLTLSCRPQTATTHGELGRLEPMIDQTILRKATSLLARKKKAIGPIRGKVCSGCQIDVSNGTYQHISKLADIQSCSNGGRFLVPEELQNQSDREIITQ